MKTITLIVSLFLAAASANAGSQSAEAPRPSGTPTPKLPLTQQWHAMCTERNCGYEGAKHYSFQQARQDADNHNKKHGGKAVTVVLAD